MRMQEKIGGGQGPANAAAITAPVAPAPLRNPKSKPAGKRAKAAGRAVVKSPAGGDMRASATNWRVRASPGDASSRSDPNSPALRGISPSGSSFAMAGPHKEPRHCLCCFEPGERHLGCLQIKQCWSCCTLQSAALMSRGPRMLHFVCRAVIAATAV